MHPLPCDHPLCDNHDVEISYDHPSPDAHVCVIKIKAPVLLVEKLFFSLSICGEQYAYLELFYLYDFPFHCDIMLMMFKLIF